MANSAIQQLAVKHNLTLCNYCMHPLEVHISFDRRTNQCSLSTSNLGLGWKYQGNQRKVASILKRVVEFWRESELLTEAENFAGSGI